MRGELLFIYHKSSYFLWCPINNIHVKGGNRGYLIFLNIEIDLHSIWIMSRSRIRVNGNRRSVVIASAVLALCMVGGLGHAHGLELTNAVLYPEARMLTATFDADVDPDSVDASKFYIREAGFATGGIQLAGSAAFANGAVVSLFLTDAHVAAQERIYSKRLAIETGAVASAAGEQFDAAFGIGTAFFAGAVSVQAVDAGSDGLGFSRDGTKMFVGDYNNHIREYALGTAFDVSTARLVGNSPRLDDSTGHFAFSPDGSRLFVSLDGSQIRQYDTAAPFDTSNLTDAGSLSVGSEYSLLYGIALSADGRNVFVADGDDGQIRQYGLPSPFDLAGASYAAALDLAPQEITPTSFAFGKDGTRMLILDDKDAVFEYALPNAFNLTGAVYGGTFIDLGSAENDNTANALGLAFDNDGRKMFVVNSPDHFAVSEYVLGTFGMEVLDETASTIRATANPDAAFVTTWQTTSANEEIMIPTDGMGGSYTVTWGDASISTHVVGDQTHVYKEPGTYLVSIYGDFTRIYLPYHPENSLKLLSIEQWGDIRWESMRGAFNGATNMVYRATDTPNLSAVTDTSEMLRFALRFNGNLSNWDVSSVTDMSDMFSIAGAFNGDISTWNVSSVTDMSNMFLATNSFDQNLGNWYVVLHDTSISGANEKLAISAQNAYLDGQNPTYAVDDPLFVVTGGALSIKPGLSVPPGSYEVTVTSTGGFGQGNSKKVEISVGAAQANNPPTVDAGQDQTVDEGDAVTLSGTASDPEGDHLTYLWSHDSALSITVSNTTSQLTTFTAPAVDSDATVTFVLSVSDGTNTDVTDQVTITIQDVPANNPPTVDAGQDQTVDEGDAVTLSGTASDPEGDHLTYLWSHDSALPITVSNATSQLTTFTAPAVNSDVTVTFVLSVSDGTNTDVTDQVTITIQDVPINNPPTVDAGQDQTVDEGDAVTLSGTASDPEGDHLTYLWSHDSALSITVSNAASQLTTFTAPAVDSDVTVTFVLSVSDGTNTDVTDQVTVTIQDVPANNPPTVDAGQDQTVDEGDVVTLNGTASDPEGGQLTYLWSHDSALPITVSNATSQLTTFTAPAVNSDATVTFVLSVSDGTNTDVTDQVTVTIQDVPANNPPTVDAGQDQTVDEGDVVTLNGTASDPEGGQLTYLWSHDSALPITVSNATSQLTTFTAPAVNSDATVTFVLSVSDGTNTDVTDQVTITIQDVPINNPPTVDAGQDQTVDEGDAVTLSGTASDPEGDQLTYLWSHDSALSITVSNAASQLTTFTAPAVDSDVTVTFVLSVSDGTNTDVTDQVTVTIQDVSANNPPTVDAGQDRAVNEGDTLTLNGTASDADGDALTYLWSHDSDLEIILDNPSSVSVSFTVPQVTSNATITFTMTVTDKHNSTGSDAVVISILDIPADDSQDPIAYQFQTNTVVWNMSDPHDSRDISRITLSSVTSGIIHATWEIPNEAPANYRISWAKAGESYLTWTDLTGNAFPTDPSHTITGLRDGEAYKVKVRASYAGTSGDWSDDVTITVTETVSNTPATGLPVIGGTVQVGQTLTVDTSGIADMNGMVNATLSYQWVSSDGATDTDIAEATTSRYVLTDGDQGRVIKVQVTFTDDAGHAESRTSDTTLTVAPASTVPGIPTGLNVLQGNSGTLNVSWQIPISDGGSAITGYTIQWKAASGNWTVPADVSEATATGTTHTITGLTDGTPYTVRIIATNHVGDGEPTPESTATPMTSQQLGPRDIGRVTLSSTTPGAIDASWVAPTETPAAYRVSWANVGGSYKTWTDLSGNAFPTATSQTITGLEEGEAYKVKVRATYAGTSGDWSGDVISTVTETVTNTLTIGPPAVQIGDDQTVGEGDTVRLSGSATDPDDDPITYTWSQTDPTTPLITFANASAPSTTFTAPSVTGDTVFTLVLTADDGTYSATDTLSITVKETGTAFITTWTASDSDRSITLPMEGTYSILWGDGSHADVSGSQSHTYGTVGNYTVTVLGDGLESSNLRNDTVNALQLRSIEQWGSTEWTSMDRAFYGAKNMVYRATDVPDLSRVTDTTYMFFNATSFDGDLSSWDVSGVTKMSGMFSDTTSFNGDISSWDVSRVTDMDSMFLSAASFNGDLSSWNVSGVTDMDSMFFETRSFNGDLSAWDVSGVTEMFAMFHDATSFNGDISAWDVSGVTDMSAMFHGATSFNGDLSAWDVSGVTDMSTMFHEASRFNGDLSAWNVSGVTDMNTMFDRAISFNGDLSAWDVSKVTDMNAMFYRATSFNGNLSSWDVSKVIKMIYMFRGATSFNGDISSWDVSGVTDMSGMFHGATSFNGDISSWDVSGVTDMSGMFHGATSFNQNLGAWYIVLDGDTMPSSTDSIGIAAQNLMLNGQNPVYTIDEAATNGDKFRIANGTHLTLRADQTVVQGQYNVTIKSTGSFGVDNSRIVEITVSEDAVPQTNNPPSVEAGQTQVVPEGSKVHLKGSATDPDGDQITYSWSHDSTQDISLANASAPSTTFTAPQVTGDTVFTLVLTANDGTYSATDTLNVTVKETGTAFITTWAASDSDRSITLPIKGAYSILWGDGTYSANVGGHQSHTYGAAGTYTVTVLGEGLERIRLYDDSANARQLGSIEQWGDTKWISMYESFYGAVNMVYRATDAPNLSRVTDMNRMFAGATAINGDLSGWDVSSVTDMSSMFYTAYAFNGDLSGWDVSSVTTMRYMFFGAHAFNGDLSGWDVSSVTTMNGMFASAHVFNGNLSGWDVSSVTDMGSMFYEAVIFSQPLDGWDVSSVTYMDGMFHSAYTFNQSLDDWDVSSVTYMRNMFYDTVAFNQNLGTWYIVPAGTDFDAGDNSLIVTTVSAQNLYLGDHNLTYGIGSGGDSDLFEMTGSTLAFKSAPNAGSYTVKVTASGNDVFENGNNWRMLEITVHDSADG